jgi:hypothetical protein
MSKGFRVSLITIGVIVTAAALLLVGINLGRTSLFATTSVVSQPYTGTMMEPAGYGQGMMEPAIGMMGPGGFDGFGMMGSHSFDGPYGMMRMMGTKSFAAPYGMMGMMGGYIPEQLLGAEPLSIEQVRNAVDGYLESIDIEGLEIGEVMIFDNHAYVQVLEQNTEVGAFELLVDPITLAVYQEHGPNMMWNQKYGSHGMIGGGRPGARTWMLDMMRVDVDDLDPLDQPIEPEQAVQAAQEYLDDYLPGTHADSTVDTFYGYYTMHILRDGEAIGMLSVSGTSGQVWVHTWHGELIETSDHD